MLLFAPHFSDCASLVISILYVWEANETICKEKPLLIKFELRSMKNFKTFGVLLSYISWEQFDNLKLTFCLYQVLWNANENIVS